MVRGCSDSDSEEERHDRFKSERNLKSTSLLRTKVPSSLENYSSRARSPLRSDNYKSSRHKSRHSEERRNSPYRRGKSPENKLSRDKKSSPILIDSTRSSSLDYKSSKHRSKRNPERRRDDKYDSDRKRSREKDDKQSQAEQKSTRERDHKHRSDGKKRSQEDESKSDCIKKRKSRDVTISDKDSVVDNIYSDKGSDSSVNIISDNENGPSSDVEVEMLPRYYEIASDKVTADVENKSHLDKSLRKHKRSKEKSQNHHDSKKRKKDKKHKRKHVKRTSESDSSSKVIDKQTEDIEEKVDSCEDVKEDSDVVFKDIDEKDTIVVDTQSEELPEEKNTSEQEEGELSASESEQCFGPALPPKKSPESDHKADSPAVDVFGPALPPSLTTTTTTTITSTSELKEEDGIFIGPLPPGHESLAQAELDARASLLRNQMENKQTDDAAVKREAWMTELPEVRGAQIGLGPRKFKTNAGPDMSDRSSWTDTPQEKEKKKLLNYEEDPTEIDTEKLEILARNKEMELLAKKSEKKSKSLLDIHRKEIKKKKKKEQKERGDQPEERRPFSREIDLETRTLNSSQKRSIIKNSQLLDTRFSSGESKFL